MFQTGNTNTLMEPVPVPPWRVRDGDVGSDACAWAGSPTTLPDTIMYTGHNNHTEALVMMQTGKIFPGARRWVVDQLCARDE